LAVSFESAKAKRIKVSGNPKQYADLEVFVSGQNLMKELAAGSRLPKYTVDISDSDVPRVVEEIADWLERSGGLSMEDGSAL
jgi:hypothetical protein